MWFRLMEIIKAHRCDMLKEAGEKGTATKRFFYLISSNFFDFYFVFLLASFQLDDRNVCK